MSLTSPRALHAQVTVAVSAPASVPARTPVLVRVEVTAPAGASVRLAPPAFAPFTLTRTDRTPTDTAGLRGSQRLEWRFVLLAGAAGTFAFEPFEADVTGPGLRPATFRSLAWSIAVLSPAPHVAAGGIAGPSAATDPGRLAFDASVAPERVYVGAQTTLELRVGVGARVRARLRRSPEFAFPSVAGVVSYDLGSRHASSALGDVHVYRRALFPLAPGVVDVPAAQLLYALTPEDDPFGIEERITARTAPRRLLAVAPPIDGRPVEWDGAVGRFRASARIDTAHARVGDAIVYTLRVEGVGNVLLLPRPPVAVPWADVATAGERVQVDSSGDLAGGAKEFDWLLTPRAKGTLRVPGVRYAFFDPQASAYGITDAAAVTVRVAPGAAAAAVAGPALARRGEVATRSEFGVVVRWDGERPAAPVMRRPFWLALAAVPVPGALCWLAAAALARRGRSGHARAGDGSAPDTPRARATAALAEFMAGLSNVLGGGALDVPAFDAATLARGLRRAGVSRALAGDCAAAYDTWARAAYGTAETSRISPSEPGPRPRDLLDRIARELDAPGASAQSAVEARVGRSVPTASTGVPFARHRFAALAIGVALLAFAVAAPQLAPVEPRPSSPTSRADAVAAFDAGVAAYAAGDAARARDLFVASVSAVPGAPAAWLNAGTAAWAVADTATASFAWQRAAHLAPTYPGLRARLDRLPSIAAVGHLGAPPAVDPRLLSGAALTAAGCAALALVVAAVRRRPDPRLWAGALACYVAAIATAGGGVLASRALDVRGLAVVRAPTALRPEPAPGAYGVAPVVTGEVAELVADEGDWRRVRLDGDRDGWLRSAQVAPLDAAP